MPLCTTLRGSASLPFTHRWSSYVARCFCYTDWVLLVLFVVMLARLSPHLDPLGTLWLAVETGLCVASIACELRLHSQPNSRLARLREPLTALWIGMVCGHGRVGQLLKAVVDSWLVPPGSLAVAAVVLLFASNVAFQMMIWAKPLRLSLALPLHLSFLSHLLNSTGDVCTGAALQTPAAHWLVGSLFMLCDLPRRAIAPPSWQVVDVPEQLECASVLSFFQFCLGFSLPLIAQAVLESRMFRQHQRQRREQGLRPERGWQAAMYEGIAEFWEPFHKDAPLLLGLATGLPCLLWQVALTLTGAESMESSVGASGGSSSP